LIDLHTHILPGVDDGVETEEDALEFARVAVADGTRTMVATPHCKEGFYDNDLPSVLAGVERLSQAFEREGIDLKLLPGAEVHLCPELVERIASGKAPTLANNGKTLLLELSLTQYPVELNNLVFQLKLAGIEILFAHPERIRYFQDHPARYEEVVRMGAYGQITTGSILGVFGTTAGKYSQELMRKGLVHVIASDGHNVRGRAPRLREAVEAGAALCGEERAEQMVTSIPEALLAGHAPEIAAIEEPVRRKTSFLGRLFKRN
jgi:protein-tyrosine phosphatase